MVFKSVNFGVNFLPLIYILLLQFSTITADNAANILSAFNIYEQRELEPFFGDLGVEPDISLQVADNTSGDKPNSIDEIISSVIEENLANNMTDTLDDLDLHPDGDSLLHAITMWSTGVHRKVRRNACLVHLLQLGIRDALKCEFAEAFTKDINKIVSWFHKSNHYYTKLRSITDLSLARPCETRWNSVYLCFKRFLAETKDKV